MCPVSSVQCVSQILIGCDSFWHWFWRCGLVPDWLGNCTVYVKRSGLRLLTRQLYRTFQNNWRLRVFQLSPTWLNRSVKRSAPMLLTRQL